MLAVGLYLTVNTIWAIRPLLRARHRWSDLVGPIDLPAQTDQAIGTPSDRSTGPGPAFEPSDPAPRPPQPGLSSSPGTECLMAGIGFGAGVVHSESEPPGSIHQWTL